jgi:protein TonB
MAIALSGSAFQTRFDSIAPGFVLVTPLPQQVAAPWVPVDAASLQWRPTARPMLPPLEPQALVAGAERKSATPSAASQPGTEAILSAAVLSSVAEQPQGADAVAISYAQQLWAHIRAHRPRGLQMQGTAEIGFRIDREGCLLWTRLTRSSGIVLLDRLALRAVREASPFPAPPQELPDARLEFTAPVNFL